MLDAMTPGSGIIHRCTRPRGLYLPYVCELKEALPSIPLIVAGRMDDPDLAANAVSDGIVDMVSLARPTLADPDIVVKLQTDHPERVRPCISCQEGCLGRIGTYTVLNCSVNPEKPDARPTPTCTRCYRTMPSGCSSSELGLSLIHI